MQGYTEKTDTQENMYMLRSTDGKDQVIWVNEAEWLYPRDIISEGSEMPGEVLGLVRKWYREVEKIRCDFQCKAEIGYVYMNFVYDDSVYQLQPAAIAATMDMFHHLSDMIREDLKEIGCPYTQYHWVWN